MKPDKSGDQKIISPNDSSLESPNSELIIADDSGSAREVKPVKAKRSLSEKLRMFLTGFNVYVMALVAILLVVGLVLLVSFRQTNQGDRSATSTQELTPEALEKLSGNEIKVGDPKSLLSVESHAVFAGSILVRGNLEVAGPIKVGGPLSLPGITVSGTSQFDQIQANSLSIAGNTTVQGQLNVQQGLTVNGSVSFSGSISAASINIDTLKLNGDIQLNRHIDAGGKTPGVSAGAAVGSGGTVSISGSDTAGTVTINVGSGAPAGVLANITFGDKFGGTPHVVITAIGSGAAGLDYYLSSRTSNGFSIATTNASASGSFSFDYIVID